MRRLIDWLNEMKETTGVVILIVINCVELAIVLAVIRFWWR